MVSGSELHCTNRLRTFAVRSTVCLVFLHVIGQVQLRCMAVTVLDTERDGWLDHFELVDEAGWDTGNNELQEYRPQQVQVMDDGAHLVMQRQDVVYKRGRNDRFLSGKLKSVKNLVEMAPNGGRLLITVRGPRVTEFWSGNSSAAGLWPAIWLLPNNGNWPRQGEIDLMEMMWRSSSPESTSKAASTLHYGPKLGLDMIWTDPTSAGSWNWGMQLAQYNWTGESVVLQFDFVRTVCQAWNLSLALNSTKLWSVMTSRQEEPFASFHDGKTFMNADLRDFAEGSEGDPARIFQRAFDDRRHGMHLLINLAFGGTPFGGTATAAGNIDWNVKSAEFVVERVVVQRFLVATVNPQ